ncbi:Nickel transporter UreH [Labilithrix luteola]|uniref:Nickel transporter UreH n=1 Tax=Labilithrix luteola TaxID=1391654 RepID=A0A0K1PWM0_9BACT|nr:hypothetical protein [Labilithrix luteola]AKU97534.1 Nickel transporter UreH [Labilithrix luteola]
MFAALTACVLGFANGLRHALEPDHLAAVSTLVAGQKSARATVRYAAAWGAGHAAMLIVAGGALALLRKELPSLASDIFELVVALVLIGLGVRGLVQARLVPTGEAVKHRHGEIEHAHAGTTDHVHVSGWTLARLPFVVGLVHGLAGSGALAALVASRVPSAAFAISFITIYAIGAAVGMSALAGVLGWPLARLARSGRTMTFLIGASACVSLGIGIWWAAPIVARLVA